MARFDSAVAIPPRSESIYGKRSWIQLSGEDGYVFFGLFRLVLVVTAVVVFLMYLIFDLCAVHCHTIWISD